MAAFSIHRGQLWSIKTLRPGQADAMRSVMKGKDALVIMRPEKGIGLG
jgi:superfamily II DNA helicase RecQ